MPPTADVSVRVAWTADAAAIATVQVTAWRDAYAGLLPSENLAELEAEPFAERWSSALAKPGDARNRVLVALERASVRGFAVTGPSPDPDADPVADGEIAELVVDPGARRAGHGSRLLQACADTLRSDRFRQARTWVSSTDDACRTFLADAGWAPDGAHRQLDLHGDAQVLVKQVRMHTDITEGNEESR